MNIKTIENLSFQNWTSTYFDIHVQQRLNLNELLIPHITNKMVGDLDGSGEEHPKHLEWMGAPFGSYSK